MAGDSQKELHQRICRSVRSECGAGNIGAERAVRRGGRHAAFFAATASGMYDALGFTHETVDGRKTYLEWEGKAFGEDVGGATILTRDEAGLIVGVRLYHRPLQMVRRFSVELAKRLKGKIDSSLLGKEISANTVGHSPVGI